MKVIVGYWEQWRPFFEMAVNPKKNPFNILSLRLYGTWRSDIRTIPASLSVWPGRSLSSERASTDPLWSPPPHTSSLGPSAASAAGWSWPPPTCASHGSALPPSHLSLPQCPRCRCRRWGRCGRGRGTGWSCWPPPPPPLPLPPPLCEDIFYINPDILGKPVEIWKLIVVLKLSRRAKVDTRCVVILWSLCIVQYQWMLSKLAKLTSINEKLEFVDAILVYTQYNSHKFALFCLFFSWTVLFIYVFIFPVDPPSIRVAVALYSLDWKSNWTWQEGQALTWIIYVNESTLAVV